MPRNPETIRKQMDKLKEELKEAERKRREEQKKAIKRAAERAGLHKTELSTEQLEREFKAIVKRQKEEG